MKHAGYILNQNIFDENDLKKAISSIQEDGRLDVVVYPSPTSIESANEILCKVYSYAPPQPCKMKFTVSFCDSPFRNKWEHVFGSDFELSLNCDNLQIYDNVAVGGTFDHLHYGHQLLLSLAAFSAKKKLIVGVTGTDLLVNKKYSEALHSYNKRVESVTEFIKYIRPDLPIDFYELKDMFGPTVTVSDLDALVVSLETMSGGGMVNEEREKRHMPQLKIIVAGLVGGPEKLSSTDLRKLECS